MKQTPTVEQLELVEKLLSKSIIQLSTMFKHRASIGLTEGQINVLKSVIKHKLETAQDLTKE